MKPNGGKTRKQFLEYPCITINQPDYKLYCFAITAKTLWQIVKINQRDPDKDKGYQRTLSSKRVKAIKIFINEKNIIPNSILIALGKDTKVTADGKKIIIPEKEDAGWVIDGQHRLAGAKESAIDIELCVIAILNLDIKKQIQQFVTINREAKGVPTSLYFDLLKHLPKKSESDMAKERAADIANYIRKNEESPFFSKIVITTPQKGQLSLSNVVRKISPFLIMKTGKFNLYTFEEQVRIFENYFKSLENVFPNEFSEKRMTFFKTLGFGAALNSLYTVFDLSIKNFGGFRVEDISKVLKKIDDFDFSVWDNLGTGSSAEIQAGETFRESLIEAFGKTTPGSLKL